MVHMNHPAISRPVVITAQWTDLPEPVVEDVKRLWRAWEMGDDYYYVNFDVAEAEDYNDGPYPNLVAYMQEHDLESALIHYWW